MKRQSDNERIPQVLAQRPAIVETECTQIMPAEWDSVCTPPGRFSCPKFVQLWAEVCTLAQNCISVGQSTTTNTTYSSAVQSQNALTVYLKREQLLPF